MQPAMTSALVTEALMMAVWRRGWGGVPVATVDSSRTLYPILKCARSCCLLSPPSVRQHHSPHGRRVPSRVAW
ncbi:MAG: hypothetical protein CK531_09200 [Gemmatimonadetes bacterium]|nr:MAG: hypothetical protein CK531_09200 [Gemmatimonadota bacterium]